MHGIIACSLITFSSRVSRALGVPSFGIHQPRQLSPGGGALSATRFSSLGGFSRDWTRTGFAWILDLEPGIPTVPEWATEG